MRYGAPSLLPHLPCALLLPLPALPQTAILVEVPQTAIVVEEGGISEKRSDNEKFHTQHTEISFLVCKSVFPANTIVVSHT